VGLSPILGSARGDLHESSFAGTPDGSYFKVAFPPDDRFDQGKRQSLFGGRLGNQGPNRLGPADFPQPGKADHQKRS
jgi:hypothetical protein